MNYDRYISAGRLENDIALEEISKNLQRSVLDFISMCQFKVVAWDWDGTLTDFKYDTDRLLPYADDKLQEYGENGGNLYDERLCLSKAMTYASNELNPDLQFIITKTVDSLKEKKERAILKHFPYIKKENIFQVSSEIEKMEVLKMLHEKYKKDVIFVEDTAKTLLNAEERFGFVKGYHISNLLSDRAEREKRLEEEQEESSPYTLKLEEGVIRIPTKKFEHDTFIKEVYLPNTLESIGINAFAFCTALITLKIPGSVKETGIASFSGCMGLEKLILEEGIEKISDFSFTGCSSLKELTLPNSLNEIGKNAFSLCVNLKTLNLGKNITKIDETAFMGCLNLKEINFEGSREELNQIEGINALLKLNPKIKLICKKSSKLEQDIKKYHTKQDKNIILNIEQTR